MPPPDPPAVPLLVPLPQPDSEVYVPPEVAFRFVPPTATTRGDDAGYPTALVLVLSEYAPASPLDAKNVTPTWPAGVRKWDSLPVSVDASSAPQLIETAV